MAGVCRCGHGHGVHEHYRPGDDCGICGREVCRSFRPSGLRPDLPWLIVVLFLLAALTVAILRFWP